MSILMGHITSFEMSSHIALFVLGCVVGAVAAVRFLRRSERSDRN
jgi:hypothetical protein